MLGTGERVGRILANPLDPVFARKEYQMKNDLDIRALLPTELKQAAAVVARGMRDNPTEERVFRATPEHRERALARFFHPLLQQNERKGVVLGAFRDEALLGVCAMVAPGRCRRPLSEGVRLLPALLFGNSPAVAWRALRWSRTWERHDPQEAHWHLGPVAVDTNLQGQGIGSALLAVFCTKMDEQNALAYLETDKATNAQFYQKFGFVTVGEGVTLQVSTWFMQRLPRSGTASRA